MMTENELTCRELVELITDYLEGVLAPAERTRFDEHIGMCSGCRNYLDQMRITIRTVGRLTDETLPAGARNELLQVFRNWKQGG